MLKTYSPTVITAPELFYPRAHRGKHSIYLAGAIDMGAAVNWQAALIVSLKDTHCVILNPRRVGGFTADTLDEQIAWELDAMEKVDTVLMWFPADCAAPVALFESGLYWNSGKLAVGAEMGFYRRRNLEIAAEWYGIPLFATLFDLSHHVALRIHRTSSLRGG